MDVSENSGTPKSSILIGFSIIINHQFWDTTIFGNTYISTIPIPPPSRSRVTSVEASTLERSISFAAWVIMNRCWLEPGDLMKHYERWIISQIKLFWLLILMISLVLCLVYGGGYSPKRWDGPCLTQKTIGGMKIK